MSRLPGAPRRHVAYHRVVLLSEATALLRDARTRIADACSATLVAAELGEITLRDDQRRTAARVAAAIARDGGCLLADDVGRGKTFVALAVARRWARPLILVPASLRSTWQDAMRRARVEYVIVSHESLSRGRVPRVEPDGIVVDESHRFRSSTTQRYELLTRIAAHAPLLLLSATPLQNSTRDLATQLALFLGARAWSLDAHALASSVIRGSAPMDDTLPAVAAPRWMPCNVDDGAVLHAILALPSPPRPLDAGDGGALRTIGLVRAWASSRAALDRMLLRRAHAATAIEQSAAAGLLPTRRELRAWHDVGADVQLGFASLLVETSVDRCAAEALTRAVATEGEALDHLRRLLRDQTDPDAGRVTALRAVRAAHPGEKVLAFSELASTVRAYHALMRSDVGVGMLTAHDARIASGRVPRADLLARFAPHAQGAREPAEREQVTLLLATDLLSEGMNLQDASVVVHLDLPWNPARLAQRVGRVRRPGGASVVHTYVLAPPANTELLLDVERRLRRKLASAERTIGRSLLVVPMLSEPAPSAIEPLSDDHALTATTYGEVADRVARWRSDAPRPDRTRLVVAGVAADRIGWLAALDDGRLLASLDGGPPDVTTSVLPAVRLSEGSASAPASGEAETAVRDAQRWLDAEDISRACGLSAARTILGDRLERRIAQAVRDASRHERAGLVALAARLRSALRQSRSLGAEHELDVLVAEPFARETSARWLASAIQVAERNARQAERRPTRLVALIVFRGHRCMLTGGTSPTRSSVPDDVRGFGW
ncbi:MAG: helicase-related protein [Gemmatimonadaceae bacterium]